MLREVITEQQANELTALSVVIPVYNQQSNVAHAIKRITKSLDTILRNYEIVVVNDGSTDRTLDMLHEIRQIDSRMSIVSYSPNRGKGFAVRMGVISSKGKNILFTDGDLDILPDSINDYLTELEIHDLVIASKRHPLSKVKAPLSRKFFSRVFNLLVRLIVGIRIKDTQSGLKAGNGEILRTIFSIMLVKRYAFDVELLAIATAMNLKIKEMPIEINIDRRFRLKEITRMFMDIIAVAYRNRIRRWYLKQLNFQSSTRPKIYDI